MPMSDEQKTAIKKLRLQGVGYRMAAKALGIKPESVEAFCKSHGLAGNGELVKLNYPIWCKENNRCILCGRKLKQPGRGRRKQFCDGRCRTRYCRLKNNTEE